MPQVVELSVQQYFDDSAKTDRFSSETPQERSKRLAFGFFGEIGGLLAGLKKGSRDRLMKPDAEVAQEELGDAIWYWAAIARLTDTRSDYVCAGAHDSLCDRLGVQERKLAPKTTFDALESLARYQHSSLRDSKDQLVRDLARDSGVLVAKTFDELMRLSEADRGSLLGSLLAAMTMVAVVFSLKMRKIAKKNLAKNQDRWPEPKSRHSELETKGLPFEQFAREYTVTFAQRKSGAKVFVTQQIKGLNIGDPLTDNSHKRDGYRFHDVFHWAYVAHLGWSPVIRALLRLKRKSDSRVDENDDGARAILIEEGIATWIFNHAQRTKPKNYASVDIGRLEYGILKQVRNMVTGFEVAEMPLWQWERAILDGFEIFRQLLEHKGGTIHVDVMKHTLTYRPPEKVA